MPLLLGSQLFEDTVERLANFFDLAPARAREILTEASEIDTPAAWRKSPELPMCLYPVRGGRRVATADCGVIRVEPGARFPTHRHRGEEWCLVLSGDAREDTGESWTSGDMTLRTAGSRHSFEEIGDVPFVFATVQHGGIEVEAD